MNLDIDLMKSGDTLAKELLPSMSKMFMHSVLSSLDFIYSMFNNIHLLNKYINSYNIYAIHLDITDALEIDLLFRLPWFNSKICPPWILWGGFEAKSDGCHNPPNKTKATQINIEIGTKAPKRTTRNHLLREYVTECQSVREDAHCTIEQWQSSDENRYRREIYWAYYGSSIEKATALNIMVWVGGERRTKHATHQTWSKM